MDTAFKSEKYDTNILLNSLSYIPFDEQTDWEKIVVSAYDIEPKSSEKRIRVYCNQILYTILEDITLKNYLNRTGIYYLYGENLRNKFPEYEKDILEAYLTFWQQVQMKLKQLSEK